MHFTDFMSDVGSAVFSNNSLSNINDLDLAYLYLEIQNSSTSFNKKYFLKLNNNTNYINSVHLQSNAYANTKNPVDDIITFLQQNLQ